MIKLKSLVEMKKVKWVKEPDEPFYHSLDGRFEINPLFLGRERPQGWEVVDWESTSSTYFLLKRQM